MSFLFGDRKKKVSSKFKKISFILKIPVIFWRLTLCWDCAVLAHCALSEFNHKNIPDQMQCVQFFFIFCFFINADHKNVLNTFCLAHFRGKSTFHAAPCATLKKTLQSEILELGSNNNLAQLALQIHSTLIFSSW